MSDRESDIEFDFFEEPDTREEAEERPRRRGSRPPVRPPTGLTPLLRLVGLISFAILIVLLLIFWVNGCRADQRKNAYRNYVQKVSGYATDSARLGGRLNTLLTTRGTKESDVENELSGLALSQEKLADQARSLEPPGRLRQQHDHLLDSFDLRANGLKGMTDAFKSTAASKNANQAGSTLAQQMKRFVASDVIWEDLFKEPTKVQLQKLSITGVNVPDSTFLPNSDIATTASMKAVWQRIHGAATGGSTCTPRGTGIVSTKVLPSGKQLTPGSLNTIQTTQGLAFSVAIKNSGCAQEVGLKVRLTIQQSPKPITKQATINLLNPGEETSVEFSDLGLPPLDQRTSLTIEVDPVPGESSTSNNTASYPVQFAVG
ncbi:MAG: CARDB domain-containing protein [Actinomycetota bacterium]